MPVEPRGLALDMRSQTRGVPLGQATHYGTTGAVGVYRCRRVAVCPREDDPASGETLFFETEALPQGEAGDAVSDPFVYRKGEAITGT